MLERKDPIDSLLDLGIRAGRLDSTMSHPERNKTYERLRARQLKLLYVSPERLLMEGFMEFLKERGISSVKIKALAEREGFDFYNKWQLIYFQSFS